MFIKPFIDSLISNPDKSLLDIFQVKPHNKTIGKERVSLKIPEDFICAKCDRTFPTNQGRSVHIGRVHKEDKENKDITVKRKRSDVGNSEDIAAKKINLKKIPEGVAECENCGGEFTYIKSFNWPMKNCNRRKKEFQDLRKATPANKEDMRRIYDKVISKSCPKCDKIIEAKDFSSLLENMQSHNAICNISIETKLNNDTPITEKYLDEMVKGVNKLSFDEKPLQSIDNVVKSYQCDYCSFQIKMFTEHIKSEHIVKDSKLIPERLETLLSMKGISIKEHRVIQAGGGGMCGVNCVSIHSTGYELMGQEIRENVNAQIV